MDNSQKKSKLLLLQPRNSTTKPKVTFQQNMASQMKNNINYRDIRITEYQQQYRKRRSTCHYQNEGADEKYHRKSYKFSQTMKKTNKSAKYKSVWITKRGTRNFYIMQNQDSVHFDENNKGYRLYSILDGHGKYGKLIAQTAGNKLSIKYQIDQKIINSQNPQFSNQKVMKNVISQVNKNICQMMPREVCNSGCTLLTILIKDQCVYCFNIGSSRAVLAIRSQSDSLISFPLSTDQNLSRFDQKYRILQSNAVLQELKDQNGCRIGPQRIWKKGQKYPGIYITRSLGMRLSYQLGVISEPQVTCLKIQKKFQFILACSDGFWQVFTNDDAIQFLIKYWKEDNLQHGIEVMMDQAVRRWDKKSQLMDDISIVVVKL